MSTARHESRSAVARRFGGRGAVVHAAKTAAAAALSWFVAADLLGNNLPVFAPLAALLTVQDTVWESLSRGLQRVAGVIVGVVVAFGFARLVGIHAWSIAVLIFGSLLLGRLLRLGEFGAIQVPVSALLVLAVAAGRGGYAWDRVIDTLLGAAVGIAINVVVVPTRLVDQAADAVHETALAVGDLLAALSGDLRYADPLERRPSPATRLEQARRIGERLPAIRQAVERADESVRWNAFGRRERTRAAGLGSDVKVLEQLERQTRGIARTIADTAGSVNAPSQWPASLGDAMAALLGDVATAVNWFGNQVGTLSPTADGPTVAAIHVHERYLAVLVTIASASLAPTAAATANAIAVDAERMMTELGRGE